MSGRVLLIEDDANITEALCFILLRDGWDVEAHSDGTTAMEKLREIRRDVLVLDVMLPGRSGYEILEELRADQLSDARHPYTRGLLNCLPRIEGGTRPLPTLQRDAEWAK